MVKTMVLGGLALALLAIFLPSLAVLLRTGCDGNFLLDIILLFLGWIPAVLHACYARSRESAEDPGYRPQMGYAPTYAPARKVRY
ncbi:hypothetical protein B0A55_08935 [Friedmanniomyces simplex]|uniref:Plasma membrane proteolipid 3 n=1 Tax=Friedmanniomyces simplex TaxID=329884 RepID=A0A4U0X0P2_9PEZI|nr:hypothetical protein B0A55_08935 [Friedmanniomyces simplex]